MTKLLKINFKTESFLSKIIYKKIWFNSSDYKTKGFQDTSVNVKVERYSQDRINLIYDVQDKNKKSILLNL